MYYLIVLNYKIDLFSEKPRTSFWYGNEKALSIIGYVLQKAVAESKHKQLFSSQKMYVVDWNK